MSRITITHQRKFLKAFESLKIREMIFQVCKGHRHGFVCASCSSSVSHSVMSEMQLIEQETPIGAKSSSRSKLDMFDEPGFTSGPPKCDSAHT